MGDVYLATRTLSNGKETEVACKVIRPDLAGMSEYVAMFHREAAVTLALGHEHIVKVCEYLKDSSGALYLIMEFVEGVSLAQLMRHCGRLPFDVVRVIAAGVLDALAYVHERHVLHRDISPGNILISRSGAVKVSDFGLAKDLAEGAIQTSGAPGKFAYVAPEMAGGAVIDARVDLFSFAAMLYHLLAGEPPFGAEWHTIAERRHSWKLAPLPADVPADLRALVTGVLRREPDERQPQTAQEARAALREPENRASVLAMLGSMVATVYRPMRTEWEARIADERAAIDARPVIAGRTDRMPAPERAQPTPEEVVETVRARPGVWAGQPESGQPEPGKTAPVPARRSRIALAALAACSAVALAWSWNVSSHDDSAAETAAETATETIVWQLGKANLPKSERRPPVAQPGPAQPVTAAPDNARGQSEPTEPAEPAEPDRTSAATAKAAEACEDRTNERNATQQARGRGRRVRPIRRPVSARPTRRIQRVPPSRGPGSPWVGRLRYVR